MYCLHVKEDYVIFSIQKKNLPMTREEDINYLMLFLMIQDF
jgi:hypothetical protein